MKKAGLIIGGALVLTLTGCATANTGPDLIAVHYTGGTASAKKFVDCLEPSSRSGFDPGDKYAAYPTRQVSYDATGGDGAEADPFTIVSKDNAELRVPATVTFRLVTDCKTLRKMHETIGARYSAAFKANGDSSDENEGWDRMLNFVIGKPLDQVLDRTSQGENWRDLWNDPQVKAKVEHAANEQIQTLVDRQAGGHFFEDFSILIQKPDPVNDQLKAAVAEEQAAVARANSKSAEANAQKAQALADAARANAQIAVAKAEAAKKKAEVEGFGGPENILKHECITQASSGGPVCNPWQPTYIVNSTKP